MCGAQLGTRSGRQEVPFERSADSGPEDRVWNVASLWRTEDRLLKHRLDSCLEVAQTTLLASCQARIQASALEEPGILLDLSLDASSHLPASHCDFFKGIERGGVLIVLLGISQNLAYAQVDII